VGSPVEHSFHDGADRRPGALDPAAD